MVDYESRLSLIPNAARREFAGMIVYLDHVVQSIVGTLGEYGMWTSTILVYVSDNGADPTSGSNWPLRGRKATLYEGGVKVPAFIHSPLFPSSSRGITYDNMMHATDWLPTLIEGVLGRGDLLESSDIPGTARQRQGLDGVNQWSHLLSGGGGYSTDSPRGEILVSLDYLNDTHMWQGQDNAALIFGPWKLILNEKNETAWPLPVEEKSNSHKSGDRTIVSNFLFNLLNDPFEHVNLYDLYPEKVRAAELANAHTVPVFNHILFVRSQSSQQKLHRTEKAWSAHFFART
jgi:arylsulfatase A-like enzyme